MANANRPMGLSPLEYIDASPWSGKCRQFFIDAADPNAYAIGDPVTLSGNGDAQGVAGITIAGAADAAAVLGVIVGMGGLVYGGPGAMPGALEGSIIPATKTRGYYVLATDDPNIVYSIQEGGVGAALTAADISRNFNLKSGVNTGFVSGWSLDNASGGTGATKQLQLMGLVQTRDNAMGPFAQWKVRINFHSYTAGAAGV